MNDPKPTAEALSPIKQALLAVREMQARLDAVEQAAREPIAVVGLGCRLPGAPNPEAFWDLLVQGRAAVGEVPPDRWTLPAELARGASRFGAFLSEVDRFDAAFFGISAREAVAIDPQHRILLEVAWEAIEDAGIPLESLAKSSTGVFVGISTHDYAQRLRDGGLDRLDAYFITGNALNAAAGRLSYSFDFRGPAMAVDTACSSSLVAVHLACQSLRLRTCDLAIACGINLILSPDGTIAAAGGQMMAPDGRCKTFDIAADGYVRGEGCGAVVLQRVGDARAAGRRIRAKIRGTAVDQDGRGAGLMVPNGQAQAQLIRMALADARVSPDAIGYLETHGTGTSLGDAIEMDAVREVFSGPGRGPGRPLVVGAVKTNIGHLESAAGIAGLIKTVLVLENGIIPQHLNFTTPNPRIPWDAIPARVVTAPTEWPLAEGTRLAGLSSFGLTGTNAHLVLEQGETPAPAPQPERAGPSRSAHLLPVSARSPAALQVLAGRYRELLRQPGVDLAALCQGAGCLRTHHAHRLALVVGSSGKDGARLVEIAGGASSGAPGSAPARRPKLAFIFSGQGGEWVGMARSLAAEEPIFRASLVEVDRALRPWLGTSVLEVIEEARPLEAVDVAQPALFAVQVALAALWRAWGIVPDAVVGHSMGEVAAAHVAGALELDQAARVLATRSRLLHSLHGKGAMAMVELGLEDALEAIRGQEHLLSVAAHNGARSTVLAGDAAAVTEVARVLSERGCFTRVMRIAFAAHSPAVEPLLAPLRDALAEIKPRAASVPFVSTVTGAICAGSELTASYWARNLRERVRFHEAVTGLMRDGVQVFLELSPHPVLSQTSEQDLRTQGRAGVVLPSLRRGEPERERMLESLGRLYVEGWTPAWAEVEPAPAPRRRLPAYPWQRERFWADAGPGVAATTSSGFTQAPGRRLDTCLDDAIFESSVGATTPACLGDHRIGAPPSPPVVVPGSFHLSLVLAAARELARGGGAVEIGGIDFRQALVLQDDERRKLQLVCAAGSAGGGRAWRVASRRESGTGATAWVLHAIGTLAEATGAAPPVLELGAISGRCTGAVAAGDFYEKLRPVGYHLGPTFRWIEELHLGNGEILGRMRPPTADELGGNYILHPGLIDSCFQVGLGLRLEMLAELQAGAALFIPVGIDRLQVFDVSSGPPRGSLWCHATPRPSGDPAVLAGDITIADESGRVLAFVQNMRVRRIEQQVINQLIDDPSQRWLYSIAWPPAADEPAPAGLAPDAPAAPGAPWLVFADRGGTAAALVRHLEQAGEPCFVVHAGDRLELPPAGPAMVRPEQAEDFSALWAALPAVPRGVVYLWALDAPALDPELSTSDALERARLLGCTGALHLVQSMVRRGATSAPRLWLVTRGAQGVGDPAPVAVQQAPLWGFGRTVTQEHQELRCTLLDLDPGAPVDDVAALAGTVRGPSGEDQLAFRRGQVHVARLTRERASRPPVTKLSASATYLITGGLGGLGLCVARWMVERGARNLVLMGRRPPADRAPLAELEARGAQVVTIACNVADRGALAEALGDLRRRLPPIRGIVHAAGLLADGLLMQQTPARFAEVMEPKIAGAWNLHALTRDLTLDFFVLFSAGATVLGAPGQANYAAANAFLDALAFDRRARGAAALSIAWGPWSEVGLAAAAQNRGERLALRGIQSLTPAQGIAALERLLAEEWTHVAVVPIDVQRWRQHNARVAMAPFLARLLAELRPETSAGGSLREALLAVEAGRARRARLEDHVRTCVAQVLRIPPARVQRTTPFRDFGLDSLMSLEIRNRLEADLGATLTATMVWNYPNVAELATYLAEAAQIPMDTRPEAQPAASPAQADQVDLDSMGEAEVLALLTRELSNRSDEQENG